MRSTQFAPSPALPGTTVTFPSAGLDNVDLMNAFGAELPCPPSNVSFSTEFPPAFFNPPKISSDAILKAGNELRSQLMMTAYDGTPSEAKALSKPRHLSIDDPISSLAPNGLALSPLSAEQSSNDDYSCCSSSASETIVTAHSRSNEGESKCDGNDAKHASQAKENTAAEAHYLGSGSTTNASWIGGLSMQPLIVPQSLQKAQAKSWDQILDMLYIIPADAHLAIRQTIIEALVATEAAKGGHAVPPVVARCLHIAISTHDPDRMRLIGLRTLEKCRPKQDDLLDKLCNFLASQQPSCAVAPVVPAVPVRQAATTRPPISYGVSAVRGDANFREAVAKKCSRPWHELIEEIRTLKPNNGYPFRVNITAAIKSATAHQVPRSAEVARRLAHSLSLYSRKSCGATKQEALKVLELAPDA